MARFLFRCEYSRRQAAIEIAAGERYAPSVRRRGHDQNAVRGAVKTCSSKEKSYFAHHETVSLRSCPRRRTLGAQRLPAAISIADFFKHASKV